jgi:hypothetical protein
VTYLDPDVVSDETQAAEFILGSLADQIPNWEPSEGSPETSMSEAMGVVSATIATLLKDEERNNYAGFGTLILGLPRGVAGIAAGIATWTITDNPEGVTIPAGSEAVWDSTLTGEPVAFATTGDMYVPPLTLTASVAMAALEPGEGGNGVVGDAAEFDDIAPGVASVTFALESSGGAAEEPLDDYVNRVADRARRIRAIPVTADDFAAAALDIPEVDRAVAINLLDLDNPPADGDPPSSDGHVSVFAITADGSALTGTPLAALTALFNTDDRPLAVRVHLGAPTYADLSVHVTVRLAEGIEDTAAVLADVEAAVTAYFLPQGWDVDEDLGGRWRVPTSDVDRPVREYDISTVVAAVAGVAGVTDVTINGAESVPMLGYAPLPHLTSVEAEVA